MTDLKSGDISASDFYDTSKFIHLPGRELNPNGQPVLKFRIFPDGSSSEYKVYRRITDSQVMAFADRCLLATKNKKSGIYWRHQPDFGRGIEGGFDGFYLTKD